MKMGRTRGSAVPARIRDACVWIESAYVLDVLKADSKATKTFVLGLKGKTHRAKEAEMATPAVVAILEAAIVEAPTPAMQVYSGI